MKPDDFVKAYLPYATQVEKKIGISAAAILAQAALESSWGSKAPGNMFFGIKDTDGVNGNEQLVTTTEYHDYIGVKYPEVISIVPVTVSGKKKFKYTVKDYFRKYNTPAESFEDHCKFFLTNPRYAGALAVKSDPYKFVEAVAKAGYATAPDYATTMKSMVDSIMRRMPK